MEFVNDPVKSKRVFILMVMLASLFFVVVCSLGYLYYKKTSTYNALLAEKQSLESQLRTGSGDIQKQIADLEKAKADLEKTKRVADLEKTKQVADLEKAKADLEKTNQDLTKQKSDLEKTKKSLEDQIAANKAKFAKIKAYTAVLSYLGDLLLVHNGLDGWTEEEFQKGRQLAVATGDSKFVETVDWAWSRKDISQMIRLVKFLDDAIAGIESNAQ